MRDKATSRYKAFERIFHSSEDSDEDVSRIQEKLKYHNKECYERQEPISLSWYSIGGRFRLLYCQADTVSHSPTSPKLIKMSGLTNSIAFNTTLTALSSCIGKCWSGTTIALFIFTYLLLVVLQSRIRLSLLPI